MSGQDTTMLPIRDTSLFDVSSIAGGVAPMENGMELILKAQIIPPAWLLFYLFVLLGYFAWIRMYYGNILTRTVQACTNFQVTSKMFQDNSLLQIQLDNVLYVLYFLSIAFLLYLMEEGFHLKPYGLNGGLQFLFNLALLVGVFFGRIVLVNLAGFLFNHIKIFKEYLYNSFIFNKLMGMAILPLLLFVVYTTGILQKLFFWLALTTVVLVIIMRLIRGVIFSFKKDVSIFYMFLYLCALEISPLVLLYRWLEGIL